MRGWNNLTLVLDAYLLDDAIDPVQGTRYITARLARGAITLTLGPPFIMLLEARRTVDPDLYLQVLAALPTYIAGYRVLRGGEGVPSMRASIPFVVAGALLLVAGAHLLQESRTALRVSTMAGPVTATLGPGETYGYTFRWRAVDQNPRVVSGRGYLLHEALTGPVSCRSLGVPLIGIQTTCSRAVFAVKLANLSPATGYPILTLVVRKPDNNYAAHPLRPERWGTITITSTEPYTTYILNTGTSPIKIAVYYGMGSAEEGKPYTIHALLLLAAGLTLIAGAALAAVRRVPRAGRL